MNPRASADNFASFSSFAPTSRQTAQGIFDHGAGNLESHSSEFSLAQPARAEPWLGYEKEAAAAAGISRANKPDWVRTSAHGIALEAGPIRQSAWPTPQTKGSVNNVV